MVPGIQQGFPRQYQVAYRPENRDLVVEFELPPQEVIPKERGYRYVKSRDVIEPLPRPKAEIKAALRAADRLHSPAHVERDFLRDPRRAW